jgi:hypothetical protein
MLIQTIRRDGHSVTCGALQAQYGVLAGWLDRPDQARAEQPSSMTLG